MTVLLTMVSMIECSGNVLAEQENSADQAKEELTSVLTEDEWSDSQEKMIVAMHWLTKPEVGVQAVEVPLRFVESTDGVDYARSLDRIETSYNTVRRDVTVRYESETPFERIYVKLEYACLWSVTLPDGTVKQGGKNGFIHELMELGQSVTSMALNLPEGAMLSDIFAFTAGQLPSWVQVWEPPCENADFLVLPTHADDEHLWFGGLMSYYAGELGYKVQVVYMTNHFNNNRRSHELLKGLWLVGIRHYPIISERFPDRYAGNVAAAERLYGHENVLEFQVEMMRRFSPKVVIAHDIHGEYGHGAHILNAQTVLEALPLTEDASVFPESAEKYGTCRVQKCYLHLWQERPIVMDWRNMPLARFDDVSALEMAVNGFHCHVSQLVWSFYVSDSGKLDCRKFGLAYTTVGDDTPGKNDMLEHVVWPNESERADDTSSDWGSDDSEKKADVSSSDQITTSRTAADQAISGWPWKVSAYDDRLVRLLMFLAFVVSSVICAFVVTAVYARKR